MTWLAFRLLARRAGVAAWGFVRRDPMLAAVLVEAAAIVFLWCALRASDHRVADLQLQQLNVVAAGDTSKPVPGVDSAQLATATRQAAQVPILQDSIDQLLHLRAVAKAHVEIVMPATTIHATADSAVHRDSARVLSFDLRSTPYTAHAEVMVPDDTAERPLIRLGIAIDTAGLWVHVGCVGDTARVAFTAPPWLRLRAGAAEQEPRVCQRIAPAIAPVSHGKRNALALTGAVVLGAVLHNNVPAWLGRHHAPADSAAPPRRALRIPLLTLHR